MLFFEQTDVEKGRELFDTRWPEARVVSDPQRRFYRGFGIERGSVWNVLGPSVWLGSLRALGKGQRPGAVIGDPLQMPGLILVDQGEILWRHRFRHAGERPDLEAVGERLAAHGRAPSGAAPPPQP